MQLFYLKEISSEKILLPPEESKHILKVLRKSVGDEVMITDGKGSMLSCEIIDPNPRKCELKIAKREEMPAPYFNSFHVAIAFPKSQNRLDWMVEKLCEIGVGTITPIISTNSERKHVSLDRIERVAISAMKQSLKAYLPAINEPMKFKHFIDSYQAQEKYLAHLSPQSQYADINSKVNDIIILIGPEGDFSDEEVQVAENNEYRILKLSDQRLRTETAAIVAINQFHTRQFLNS